MKPMEGEILKNRLTEDLHVVKKIGDTIVILENENGSVCVSLRKKDLESYYETFTGGDA